MRNGKKKGRKACTERRNPRLSKEKAELPRFPSKEVKGQCLEEKGPGDGFTEEKTFTRCSRKESF